MSKGEPDEAGVTCNGNVPGDDYDEFDLGPDGSDYGVPGELRWYEDYIGSSVCCSSGPGVCGAYWNGDAFVSMCGSECYPVVCSVWADVVDDACIGMEYVGGARYVSTFGYVPDDDGSISSDERGYRPVLPDVPVPVVRWVVLVVVRLTAFLIRRPGPPVVVRTRRFLVVVPLLKWIMSGPDARSLLNVRRTFPVIRLYEATLLQMPTNMDLIRGLDSMTDRSLSTIVVDVLFLTLRKPVGAIPAFRPPLVL